MEKSNINPACLQAMLESAVNAAEKGQSQFFTPPDFGAWCAQILPKHRPVIVDLNCGNGQLLQASATKETVHLLGSDIDPSRSADGIRVQRITHDTTLLYARRRGVHGRGSQLPSGQQRHPHRILVGL